MALCIGGRIVAAYAQSGGRVCREGRGRCFFHCSMENAAGAAARLAPGAAFVFWEEGRWEAEQPRTTKAHPLWDETLALIFATSECVGLIYSATLSDCYCAMATAFRHPPVPCATEHSHKPRFCTLLPVC